MVNVHSSGEWSSWHRSLWSNFGSLGARRGCHSTLSFSYILSRFYSFFNLVRRIGGREEGATHTLAPGKRGWPHPPLGDGASGGNCTRVPSSTSTCPTCGYDMVRGGWPEHGREDEALRELVSNWHRLSPSVRDAIMAQVRTSQR